MPARSQAQRGYLATHFGPAWMRKHHFDNKGKLPDRVENKRGRMIRNFQSKHRKPKGHG